MENKIENVKVLVINNLLDTNAGIGETVDYILLHKEVEEEFWNNPIKYAAIPMLKPGGKILTTT